MSIDFQVFSMYLHGIVGGVMLFGLDWAGEGVRK